MKRLTEAEKYCLGLNISQIEVMEKVTYACIEGNLVLEDCGIKDCLIIDTFTIKSNLLPPIRD